jgi:hypothetical protein
MEDQSQSVTDGVAATSALADATVIVLSPNGDFTNERVLQVGDGIAMEITDDAVILSVQNVALTQAFPVTFLAQGLTNLVLPVAGTLVSSDSPTVDVNTLGAYTDDTAAAAAGVPVGGLYRNAASPSQLMVRVS